MNQAYVEQIASELKIRPQQVAAVGKLLGEGGTVPFIARYRKEATDTLDEVAITNIRDRFAELATLDQRRQSILKSLEERSLLTDALKSAVLGATTLTKLEDIYQPYRPKRRTRATIAKEAGLEPLANTLFEQKSQTDPVAEAASFVDPRKGIEDVEQALAGARDIIAERVSDSPESRSKLRRLFQNTGEVRSTLIRGKEAEGAKFKDYFDWKEPLAKIPSHRLLAIRRGEAETVLMMRIGVDDELASSEIESLFVSGQSPASEQVRLAVQDGYKRLLCPAIEVETRLNSKKLADVEAIRVFADNLTELLMAPALGQKNVLGIDPGFRSGCKIVCLDAQGKLLHNDVIFPTMSGARVKESAEIVLGLCARFKIEAIAIGNGTAVVKPRRSFERSACPKASSL